MHFANCLEAALGASPHERHAGWLKGRCRQVFSALRWHKAGLSATPPAARPPAARTRLLLCQAWSCEQHQGSESMAAGLQAVKRMLQPADPPKASPFNLDAPELLRLQSQVLDRAVMEQRSTLEDRCVPAIWVSGASCSQNNNRAVKGRRAGSCSADACARSSAGFRTAVKLCSIAVRGWADLRTCSCISHFIRSHL